MKVQTSAPWARAIAVLACSALLAACGGGGGEGGSPTPTAALSLYAGSLQRPGGADGVGAAAQFNAPEGVAQDSVGNIYVADKDNHTIRKIATNGAVTTLAGTAGKAGSADGTGAAARFSSPRAVAVDVAGNVHVADTGNGTIRRISPAGVVSTLAGAAGQFGATDGAGSLARFASPTDLALDAAGSLYVGDGSAVRKVMPDGTVSTFAGSGTQADLRAGDGTQARFRSISGVAVDSSGNVNVSESPDSILGAFGRLRRFDPQGRALALGNAADGILSVSQPSGLAADAAGNIFVASGGFASSGPSFSEVQSSILKINGAGAISTVAGKDNAVGSADGPGTVARFNMPKGIAVGAAGSLVVADTSNHSIRRIDNTGRVTTVAGGAGNGYVEGAALDARFFAPAGIAAAADGTLYVADVRNGVVRKISPGGAVSTVLITDATGTVLVNQDLENVAVDAQGTLYVAQSTSRFGRGVWAVDPSGRSRLVDSSSNGNHALAVDSQGNLYLSETTQVVVIPRGGPKRVLATGFVNAWGLAVDAAGTVYVADVADHTVRSIDAAGNVSLRAGRPNEPGYRDGGLATALLEAPRVLTVDAAGNLYIADNSKTIRKVTPSGTMTTLAGTAGQVGVQTGPLPGVLDFVWGLAWIHSTLYATVQNAVIRISPVN